MIVFILGLGWKGSHSRPTLIPVMHPGTLILTSESRWDSQGQPAIALVTSVRKRCIRSRGHSIA